jgi:WD40 repeat protein
MKCVRSLWGHVRGVTALGVWHSTHLLSGSHDTKIRVWDLSRDCKCVAQLEGHRVTVWSIESDPHTPTVFSGAGDGYIKVWRIDDTPRCEATLQHGDGKVRRTVCYKGAQCAVLSALLVSLGVLLVVDGRPVRSGPSITALLGRVSDAQALGRLVARCCAHLVCAPRLHLGHQVDGP